MTDVLDRRGAVDERAEARPPADTAGTATRSADPVRWGLAALMVGAGAIHVAMVPSHLDASAIEGVGFLAAAWVQLGLAVALVRAPGRRVLAAVVAVNVALIATWLVSRTVGLPVGAHAGEAESVTIVDGVCVALQAGAIVLAIALLRARGNALRTGRGAAGVAVVAVVATVALTSTALASPDARDHAHGGGDAAGAAAHDHGEGSGEGAVAAAGHDHGDGVAAADGHGDGHGEHDVDDLGFAALQNGHMHDHGEGDGPAEPLDPQTAAELAAELALTAPLVEQYPTVSHAKAAGYRRAGPFSPGLGTHFTRFGPGGVGADGRMTPEAIADPVLIFDGLDDDAPLAGFMYMAYGEDEPEGFAGHLDRWHYHTDVCIVMGPEGIETPFGADLPDVTEELCAAEGGTLIELTGWMVHVWTVPGYESPLGTFSDLNPRLTCPDGTYHALPTAEIGSRATTCRGA